MVRRISNPVIYINHWRWLEANGYKQQASSCKQQAASLTRKHYNDIREIKGEINMTKKQITIHWGTDKEPQDKKSYEFKTDEQLKYFMMGVDEANGWLEYEVEDENK